ncbi:DinB family protein [Pedobacter sp. 22163]|uniref:DinB family protein n=1 Tax=Pedobacter sp. 22163 TaxID=3453883 RepID=UPI003F85DD6D
MENILKAWKASRKMYMDFFNKYSLEQLNKVPKGFNNNLIWNIGHIIITQQKLIYKGANLKGYISDDLFDQYKSGTKPTAPVSENEANSLKGLLTSMVEKTELDVAKGIFISYNERITGIGFHLESVRDAFECNNYHEGMHLGYMMGIRKFV